jgi:hypothetical protein
VEDLVHDCRFLGQCRRYLWVSCSRPWYRSIATPSNLGSKLTSLYSFSATIPTVIEELGYSAADAQLLTIPLYVFAAILTITLSFLSDKAKTRWYFIVSAFGIAVAGFIAQLAIPHPKFPGLTYAFLFPVAGGMYSGYPPMISWMGKSSGHRPI